VTTVTNKVMTLFQKRGLVLLAISAISALLAAKGGGGIQNYGFWDGPV
jgi:hypothetical protein